MTSFRLAVHGLAVEVSCAVAGLPGQIDHYLGTFSVPAWPAGFSPAVGVVRSYDADEIGRCLSSSARRVGGMPDYLELYEENERYWLIDERWGLAEINLLKSQ